MSANLDFIGNQFPLREARQIKTFHRRFHHTEIYHAKISQNIQKSSIKNFVNKLLRREIFC